MNEQALKERLKYIARTENCTFGEVWKKLLLERFLCRISRSKYHDKFIFKGGLLLSYYIELKRETTDIDFLADNINAQLEILEEALKEICDVVAQDGFRFQFRNIEVLEHNHMDYPGFRVSINVNFEELKDVIKIDIGVGDNVNPRDESLELYRYKGKPIFEGSVSLKVYPIEAIFSEKLETIVSRGSMNSRMKDFHDVLLLCRENGLMDAVTLNANISRTFANRDTVKKLPIEFTKDEYDKLQNLWGLHNRSLSPDAEKLLLPNSIQDVINEINAWLKTCSIIQ